MPNLIPWVSGPGTWADTTMRKPASPVAHALLIGIEGASIVLALFVVKLMPGENQNKELAVRVCNLAV